MVQTDSIDLVANSTQTDAAATTASASASSSSIAANKTASKSSSSISSSSTQNAPSPELTQLKTRIDNLILEKNSLRVRNDELAQDLDAANRKLAAALATQPVWPNSLTYSTT